MRCSSAVVRLGVCFASAIFWSSAALAQRVMTLDVAATSTQGEPVTDLQAADVQIREDGKVRPIVFFRFAGDRRPSAPEVASPMVILFDHWNARMLATGSAWQEFENTLKHLPSLDRVYIDFVTGRGELFPIRRLPLGGQTEESDAPPKGPLAEMDERVRKFQAMRDSEFDDPFQRANATFEPLYRLVQSLGPISGRKSLIWVTHNPPVTARQADRALDFSSQFEEIIRAGARSRTAIYTINQGEPGARKSELAGDSKQTLQMIAAMTGGRFYPKADLHAVVAEAAADARGNYRVAYDSAVEATDPTEHKFRVEPARKGIRLHSREAYRAAGAQLDPDLMEQMALSNGSLSPFDATDIGLRVATSGNRSSGTMHFAIRVEPADVLLDRRGDRYQGKLSVAFAFYGEGFLEQAPAGEPFNIDLSPEQVKDGIHIARDVPVTNKVQRVRVMVFDPAVHGLGTVTVPLH